MLLGIGPDGPVKGRRVAVTGLGAVTCCGVGVDALWDGLINPTVIGGAVRDFDPGVWFGPKEVRQLDKFAQFSIAAANMAVSSAGDLAVDPAKAGVMFATGVGGLETLAEQVLVFDQRGANRVSPRLVPMMMANVERLASPCAWAGAAPARLSVRPVPPALTPWRRRPSWSPAVAATWPSVAAPRPAWCRWPWPPSPT